MVDPILGAAAISAGANLIGGFLSDSSDKKANKQALKAQKTQNENIMELNREQMDYAHRLNTNKIQWTVEDAKKAGIHPLAALGVAGSAALPSFATPVAEMGQPSSGSAIGEAISNSGTAIGNAMLSQQDVRFKEAQIRNMEASTAQMLADATSRTQIAGARAAGQTLNNTPSKFGVLNVHPNEPGAAQRAEDDFGDLAQELFGPANYGAFSVDREAFKNMGPLSRNFWEFLVKQGVVQLR